MQSCPMEIIEFAKLLNGEAIRCRVVVFDDFACLVSRDWEIPFGLPDFRGRAISHAEQRGYVRVSIFS